MEPILPIPKSEAQKESPQGSVDPAGAVPLVSFGDAGRFFQLVLDSVSEHIAVTDQTGCIVFVNRAWRNFGAANGYIDPQSGIGRNYFDLCEPTSPLDDDVARTISNGIRAALEGLPGESVVEYACHSPDEERWFEAHITGFQEGGRRYAVISHRNITALKKIQATLLLHSEELARSNADLERFAYIASHDLQEPLRMVISFTQLLERRYKGQLTNEADEFIHYAVDGALRMQTLINDLLLYSRLGTQGQDFHPVDCNRLLAETVADLRNLIEQNDAEVTHDKLPVILGDYSQIQQLFQNLISNSVKFRRNAPPKIHIGVRRQKEKWLLSVQDNGIGINPQYFDRIFIVFQRLHTQREYPGTGMGLAICKRIVERHGGTIWVESQPDSGSIFYFTLPIRKESQ